MRAGFIGRHKKGREKLGRRREREGRDCVGETEREGEKRIRKEKEREREGGGEETVVVTDGMIEGEG